MKPGEIKSLRKCYCSFVTPECKGSWNRQWKMALQTTRESLIGRGKGVLLRALGYQSNFTSGSKCHLSYVAISGEIQTYLQVV